MGYSTDYKGEFKFTRELKASEIAKLKSFFGEDCRDHTEWKGAEDLYYINLKFNSDFSGIEWDGCEKTDDLTNYINLIFDNIDIPDFGLSGKILAQGEDIDDRYEIVIKDGRAVHIDTKPSGSKVECPHCGEKFYLE